MVRSKNILSFVLLLAMAILLGGKTLHIYNSSADHICTATDHSHNDSESKADDDDCSICKYSFSSFVEADCNVFSFEVLEPQGESLPYLCAQLSTELIFSASRAPPVVIL